MKHFSIKPFLSAMIKLKKTSIKMLSVLYWYLLPPIHLASQTSLDLILHFYSINGIDFSFQGYTIEDSGFSSRNAKELWFDYLVSLKTDRFVYFYSSLFFLFWRLPFYMFFFSSSCSCQPLTVVLARSVCKIVHAGLSLEIYWTKQLI